MLVFYYNSYILQMKVEVNLMKVMKILSVILGIFLIIGGVSCIFSPLATYSVLAWVIGFTMLMNAMGGICTYSERKEMGLADGWTLAGAIISMVLAIVLLCSNLLQLTIITMIPIIAGAWMLVDGIVHIISAIKMHRFRQTLPSENRGKFWIITLIVGIIMVVCGITGFMHPFIMTLTIGFTIGILMGIYVVISGVKLISIALFS